MHRLKQICLLWGVVFGVAMACAWAGETEKPETKSTPKPGWKAAPKDKDGRLIAAHLMYNGRGEGGIVGENPITFEEQYGIAVLYREGLPKAFYVLNNVDKTYYATRDFEPFLKQVAAIPDGATFAWIGTCTIASYANLPKEKLDRLNRLLEEKKLDPDAANPRCHICYCTATSIRWLDIPGPKGDEPCEWVFRA